MAYKNGKCNGVYELMDELKALAISAGWEVLNDKSTPLDRIPAGFEGCLWDGSVFSRALIDGNLNVNSGTSYFSMPRKLKPTGFSVSGTSGEANVSIWGVNADNSEVALILNAKTSGNIVGAAEFYRYRISANAVSEVQILFKENTFIQSRELNLKSKGKSGREEIYLNLRGFLGCADLANLAIANALSYSPPLPLGQQHGSPARPVMVYGRDGEMEYFANFNPNRLILALKIHDPLDAYEKDPVYQIGYFGKIRIFGGEWSMSDLNVNASCSTDASRRWSSISKSSIDAPSTYFSGSGWSACLTNASGWNDANMNIAPYPDGELFSCTIPIYNSTTLAGEYDGLYKLAATDGTLSGDILNLSGQECIVIEDGKKKSKYDFYAISKE